MITCNNEILNKQMKNLYNLYNTIDTKRIKYTNIYDTTSKIQLPLLFGTLLGGFIVFDILLDSPLLYTLGCVSNTVNMFIKLAAEDIKKFYEEELKEVKSEIIDLEYQMFISDQKCNNRSKDEMACVDELERSNGIKVSKYHDFKYTKIEIEEYEKENDLRYNLDRYGIHRLPKEDRFYSELTGDYENPVFVLMNDKGKVLSKRPKYKNNNK